MRKFVRPGRRERAIGNNHRNRVRALVSSTALVAVSTLFAPAMPAQAQTNWTAGANSTDWFTAGNWDNGVPTAGHSATLDTVTPFPTVIGGPGASAQIVLVGNQGTGQLTIQDGGELGSSVGVVGALAGSHGGRAAPHRPSGDVVTESWGALTATTRSALTGRTWPGPRGSQRRRDLSARSKIFSPIQNNSDPAQGL